MAALSPTHAHYLRKRRRASEEEGALLTGAPPPPPAAGAARSASRARSGGWDAPVDETVTSALATAPTLVAQPSRIGGLSWRGPGKGAHSSPPASDGDDDGASAAAASAAPSPPIAAAAGASSTAAAAQTPSPPGRKQKQRGVGAGDAASSSSSSEAAAQPEPWVSALAGCLVTSLSPADIRPGTRAVPVGLLLVAETDRYTAHLQFVRMCIWRGLGIRMSSGS